MVKNSSWKSSLLMLALVVVLGGLGVLLQKREPAVFAVPGPFKVFVKKVELVPLRPGEVQDGYDTKVEVELGAKGRAPWWWQKGFGGYVSTPEGQLVAKRDGATKIVGVPWHSRPSLEMEKDKAPKWVTTYLLKLAPVAASVGEVRLRHRIIIEGDMKKYGPPVWLDKVVRRQGEHTSIPVVSRNPRLKLERWALEEIPPVEVKPPSSKKGTGHWRLSLSFLKQYSPSELNNGQSYGVGDDLTVRDGKGRKGSLWGSTQWMNGNRFLSGMTFPGREAPDNSRRSLIVHTFNEFDIKAPLDSFGVKLKPPFWIEGEASWNKNWPLWVKIPFRDANGKTLVTGRPAPAFRVVSTTARSASPEESSLNGADTMIDVVLETKTGRGDVSQWQWEGDYSQHIQDAQGRNIWDFPYVGGTTKQPAIVDYLPGMEAEPEPKPSRMTIRYALILASIPKSAGKLTFHAKICANGSRRVPVKVVVR